MMMILLKAALVICVHLAVFTAIGTPVCMWTKRGSYSLTLSVILGYFIWFAVFGVLGELCIFLRIPTRGLAYSVLGIAVVMTAAGILAVFCAGRGRRAGQGRPGGIGGNASQSLSEGSRDGRDASRSSHDNLSARSGYRENADRLPQAWFRALPAKLKDHGPAFVLLAAVVLYQCLFQAVYTDGSQDAAFYVSLSSVAVEKNALALYNVYNGVKSNAFSPRYVFSPYPYHSAAVSVLTGLPAIVTARTVMPVVHVFVANCLYYRIGRELFREQGRRAADLFVGFILLLNICCRTLYLPAAFFIARLYEGKAIVANLVVPMILLCMLILYPRQEKREAGRWPWLWLFACNVAAVCFSGSAFIGALAQTGMALPVLIRDRKWRTAALFLFSMLPYLAWGIVYLLCVKGYLSLAIQ